MRFTYFKLLICLLLANNLNAQQSGVFRDLWVKNKLIIPKVCSLPLNGAPSTIIHKTCVPDSGVYIRNSTGSAWVFVGPVAAGGGGTITSGLNVGNGIQVYRNVSGSIMTFRTLLPGNMVGMSSNADEIRIGLAQYGAAVGQTMKWFGSPFDQWMPANVLDYPNAANRYLNGYGNFGTLHWDSISSKPSLVPTTRTITINGTSWDLTANRSWSVGDLLSSGSYANPAWLTSLAWSKISGAPSFLTAETDPQFDTKFAAKTTDNLTEGATNFYFTNTRARSVLSVTNTGNSGAATYNSTTGVFNIPNYTLAGLGGEPSIGAGTTAQYWRGDKTWQTLNTTAVAEGTNLYFTEPRVRSTVLTGYTVGGNTALAATDNLLGAFGKVQGQLNAREATIAAGTTAQYWRGDKTWQTLNTTAVAEGTNQYFTNTRARSALSATAPVQYDGGTGTFSMTQADGTTNGWLSSTHWNTFNNKVGGTGTTGTLARFSGSNTIASIANGTDGQVMTIVAGSPAWAAPSSGGGIAGTAGRMPVFTSSSAVGDSKWQQNGTNPYRLETYDATTQDVLISVGRNRTGNGTANLELYGEASNSTAGLLIQRFSGANAASTIAHRGSNYLNVTTDHPLSAFQLSINSVQQMFIDTAGVKLADLQGTGTRMVVAASDGRLSTQAIPSGGSGSLGYGYLRGTYGQSYTVSANTWTKLGEYDATESIADGTQCVYNSTNKRLELATGIWEVTVSVELNVSGITGGTNTKESSATIYVNGTRDNRFDMKGSAVDVGYGYYVSRFNTSVIYNNATGTDNLELYWSDEAGNSGTLSARRINITAKRIAN
jgi:hypothetical protein